MEQVQSLAAAAGDDAASKADIIHKLDELAQQAVASDEKSIADAAKAASKALARSDESGATEVRQEIAQAMSDFAAPPPPAPAAPATAVSATATAEDDEMLEVFFEEAEEVIAGARESLAKLAEDPQHFESISTVRRAFHTLKGSSRMVGLKDFGDAAWACEQLYNARLADHVIEADPGAAHVLAERARRARGLGQGARRPQRHRLPQRAHRRRRQRAARRRRSGCRAGQAQGARAAPAVEATAVLPPMPRARTARRPRTTSSPRPRRKPATPRSSRTSRRPRSGELARLQRTSPRSRTHEPALHAGPADRRAGAARPTTPRGDASSWRSARVVAADGARAGIRRAQLRIRPRRPRQEPAGDDAAPSRSRTSPTTTTPAPTPCPPLDETSFDLLPARAHRRAGRQRRRRRAAPPARTRSTR